uniref:Glutathione transferase n=1 Tax=Helicotheca tamesis TaxID=374047 RepID=A0A6U0HIL5_9STRA|mmetsp:Transcript_6579/g.8888  ORF Transcript_6579/g.8888 Transcript_6579/m.8888 type:complete len:194 (+) Transcript_6579:59-640(+)|eukprot:CAMPEP_0185723698 /NCGR_PEP_ID=MMETSP1171-20130828/453_1 /TAXON_ID=374046 /ORGANISM="Helicotheca tamensis, Strain CCMP826" /LENGTH=193 /DNA_ID=CAMNT_0028391439 /DNA_START=48 /DNA_END=632 /DNA_ORIENTATION=+
MALFLAKSTALSLAATYAESKYGPSDTSGPLGVSSLFGLTPTIFSGLSFWVLAHGMKVGKARAKYIELAKKDGEKDVEERYALPNLYAQGTSKYVREFNCVQRSHQHIFETFTGAVLTGMVAAVNYPISAAATTLMYAVGRITLSNGYAAAEGDPMKRYASPFARFMWYGYLGNIILSLLSCANMVAGKKLLW